MRDYRAILKCKGTHTIFVFFFLSLSDPLLKSHYTFTLMTLMTYRNNITKFANGSHGILMKFLEEA